MKAPLSSPLSLSARFLASTKEGPKRVESFRSLSRLLAWALCAASVHVTTDPRTPGQNINRLALTTEHQQRWGPAAENYGQVGLFHFHFNFRRAS